MKTKSVLWLCLVAVLSICAGVFYTGVALSGGSISGPRGSISIVTDTTRVLKAGDTMTGALLMSGATGDLTFNNAGGMISNSASRVFINDALGVANNIYATGSLLMGDGTYGVQSDGDGDFADVYVADDVIAGGDGLFTGNIYATGALCMDGACVYGIDTNGGGDFNALGAVGATTLAVDTSTISGKQIVVGPSTTQTYMVDAGSSGITGVDTGSIAIGPFTTIVAVTCSFESTAPTTFIGCGIPDNGVSASAFDFLLSATASGTLYWIAVGQL